MPNSNSLSQWLSTSPVLAVPRRATWRVISWLLAQRNMTAVPAVENGHRSEDYDLIRGVIHETDMLLLQDEAYQLLSCVRATANTPGEIAEVVVYRGGAARLLCGGRGGRNAYLLDSLRRVRPDGRLASLL